MTDFDTPAPRQVVKSKLRDQEVWESNVEGRVFVEASDHRGDPVLLSTLGVGQRMRVTTDDRILAQERVRDIHNDPFVNGMLRRVDADQSLDETTKSPNAVSDDDLRMVFTLDEADFIEQINDYSEVVIRRMKALAPVNASIVQGKILDDLIAERYPIGGEAPSWPGPSNLG